MLRKFLYAVVGIILAANMCGCALLLAGVAGGAGTAFWLKGKLSSEVDSSYENTVNAAKKALKSFNMEITKETRSNKVTQLKSNYTDGSEVWIDIRPVTEKSSKVEVRVGIKGNEEASGKIMERIKKYL